MSAWQVADNVPHQRQHLKHAGNDGQHRGAESQREVNRQEQGGKIDGSEDEAFFGEKMLQMFHEAPQEGKRANDEERSEGEKERELASFE